MRTIFPLNSGTSSEICTQFAQNIARPPDRRVKFPVTIRHRASKAKIYAPAGKFKYYRVAVTVAGKREMRTFANYSDAKAAAERIVKDIASGSQAASLTATQSRDALAAFERLQGFYQTTGRRVSLLSGISEFCEAAAKIQGRSMNEAIDGYLGTVASVKRKDIKEAVTEFLQTDVPRTKAAAGERAQLSAKYAYNRQLQLNRFANSFHNTAVCDLSKEHLDAFIGGLAKVNSTSRNRFAADSAKSRNHYRNSVRQFLQWAVRKDYLAQTHRLSEADAMRSEHANTADVQYYLPDEFSALLAIADETLRPMIAIGGLAGLRTQELLRLDWADVWRVEGHIEITAGKAKTRQRRVIEICPALSAWLKPCKKFTSGKLWKSHEVMFQQKFVEACGQAILTNKGKKIPLIRKPNGLRHAFCTFHFALHSNENLTAQQAGNSPAMIHGHYKGLVTKADAERWFNVVPTKVAKRTTAPSVSSA
jgi:integrase